MPPRKYYNLLIHGLFDSERSLYLNAAFLLLFGFTDACRALQHCLLLDYTIGATRIFGACMWKERMPGGVSDPWIAEIWTGFVIQFPPVGTTAQHLLKAAPWREQARTPTICTSSSGTAVRRYRWIEPSDLQQLATFISCFYCQQQPLGLDYCTICGRKTTTNGTVCSKTLGRAGQGRAASRFESSA